MNLTSANRTRSKPEGQVGRLHVCVVWFMFAASLFAATQVLAAEKGDKGDKGIYGLDDRRPVFFGSAQEQAAARSVFAMMPSNMLEQDAKTGKWRLVPTVHTLREALANDPALAGKPVCDDEPFADEIAPAFCSGVWIGGKRGLTAAHCVFDRTYSGTTWKNARLVFDFDQHSDNSVAREFEPHQVYQVTGLLDKGWPPDSKDTQAPDDWALLELDRAVEGRQAVTLEEGNALPKNAKVTMVGHPLGLPKKLNPNGAILSEVPSTMSSFITNLDAYHGNSGAPVFDAVSIERGQPLLLGLLVSGGADFALRGTPTGGECITSHRCPAGGAAGACEGERVMRASVIARSPVLATNSVAPPKPRKVGVIANPDLALNQLVDGGPASKSVVVVEGTPSTGCKRNPVWCKLSDIATRRASHFSLTSDRDRYTANKSLIGLTVDVPEDGYLYVFMVDANDELVLVYPNIFSIRQNTNVNWHRKGKFRMGKRCGKGETCLGFALTASEPLGETLFVATVMKTPLDLDQFFDAKGAEKSATAGAVGETIYVQATGERPSGMYGMKTVIVDAGP